MRRAGATALAVMTALAALLAGLLGGTALPAAATTTGTGPSLYLVTLTGPGTAGYAGDSSAPLRRLELERRQDAVLAGVGAPTPVYRWTTALDGVAVPLSRAQADQLAGDPRVALVERSTVRRLAGRSAPTAGGLPGSGLRRGGAGTVIGFVDSGLWPENPLFATLPGLGRAPRHFHGSCQGGSDWPATACRGKVVGARWFVDGFGADRVGSAASLSARDDEGHGSEMASIAAGDAGVSVQVHDQRLGSYGGVAPQARIAVYKACWTAPDPADDGCSTADLVTAIDRATRDGVDVLNLSVGGTAGLDTVERALLGAAEADIVVVGAAGNHAGRAYAAHPGPWVTTVGSTTGVVRRGRVLLVHGPRLTGAMAATRGVGPARLVLAADAAAPDATRAQARVCRPGSLDAARVRGAVVLCERGVIGRVDKSAAVETADGVGMVLANRHGADVAADFHSVPTVHLDARDAATLRRWASRHPAARVALRPLGVERPAAHVTPWSAGGNPTLGLLKPDVVAPGAGLLGAVPPTVRETRWDFVSGTSAATAYTSGTAALLRSEHPGWGQDVVRSVLATTAATLAGSPSALRAGAGRVRPHPSGRPGVAYETSPRDYRAWLEGRLPANRLNTPSLLLAGDHDLAERTITNLGHRALYFSSHAYGFSWHAVTVTPAAVRLAPGESATFDVHVHERYAGGVHPADDGWVTWRGADGSRSRIPVLLSR